MSIQMGNEKEVCLIQHECGERQRKYGLVRARWAFHGLMVIRNKYMVLRMATLISGLLLTVGVLKAAEEQEIPEEITLQSVGYKARKKGPVELSHSDHAENYDVACTECHHVYKDGKNVWEEGQPVQKCSACHDPNKSQGKVKKLQIAFHQNCKGCHRARVKEGISEDAPYKQCSDCHEKKS
jgi:hypothetical protein